MQEYLFYCSAERRNTGKRCTMIAQWKVEIVELDIVYMYIYSHILYRGILNHGQCRHISSLMSPRYPDNCYYCCRYKHLTIIDTPIHEYTIWIRINTK